MITIRENDADWHQNGNIFRKLEGEEALHCRVVAEEGGCHE